MRSFGILSLVAVFSLLISRANASLITYDWTTDPSGTKQVMNDPLGDNTGSGSHDILDIMVAHDASYYYFRMDLRNAPTLNDGAGTYSIQIDDAPGGGVNIDTHYIALGLVGIDQIVMSHFSPGTNEYVASHRHDVLAPTPGVNEADLDAIGGGVDHTANGGTTLQWTIPVNQLNPGPFKFFGAIHDLDANITYDTTAPVLVAVPEPSTLTLLSLLVGSCAMIRRRLR
jgi:hypothetical protein